MHFLPSDSQDEDDEMADTGGKRDPETILPRRRREEGISTACEGLLPVCESAPRSIDYCSENTNRVSPLSPATNRRVRSKQ